METPGSQRDSERRGVPRTITPLSTPAHASDFLLQFPLKAAELQKTVRAALDEDQAFNDITTIATVVSDQAQLKAAERMALDFLNTDRVLRWAEKELGL